MSYKILNDDKFSYRCNNKNCDKFEKNVKKLNNNKPCSKCGKKLIVIKETKYRKNDHVVTIHDQVYHASEIQTLKHRSEKAGEIKYKKFQVPSIFAEQNKDGKFVPEEVNTNIPVLSSNYYFDWKVKDYTASVKKSKKLVSNLDGAFTIIKRDWASLVHELCIAQEVLSNRGSLKGYTFKKYFLAIGLTKPTVYRWLKIAHTAEKNDKTLQEQVDEIGKSGEKGKSKSITAIINLFIGLEDKNRNDFVSFVLAMSHDLLEDQLKVIPKKLLDYKFANFLLDTDFSAKLEKLLNPYYVKYEPIEKAEEEKIKHLKELASGTPREREKAEKWFEKNRDAIEKANGKEVPA